MKLYNFRNKEVKLIDQATGKEVKIGDDIISFRGEHHTLRSMRPPHKSSSVGFVNDYYASVFNLKFEEVD